MSCLQNTCKQTSEHQVEKTGIEQALARRHQTMTNLWEGPGNKSREGFNLLIAQSVPNLHVYRAAAEWKQSTGPNLIHPAEAKTSCQGRRAPIWNSYFLPFPLVVWKEVIIHQRRARNLFWHLANWSEKMSEWSLPLLYRKQTKQNNNNRSEIKCQPFWWAKRMQVTLQRINHAKRWEPYLSYWADIQTWLRTHSSIWWVSSFTHSFPELLTFCSNHPLHPESISMALSSSLLTFCQVYLWLTSLSCHSEVSACCSVLLIQWRARPQEPKVI